MKLPQTVFYLTGHFEKSNDTFSDLKKVMEADGYCPGNLNDVIRIIINNLWPDTVSTHILLTILGDLHPQSRWKINSDEKDSHEIAILKSIGSMMHYMTKKELGITETDEPDYNILPKYKEKQ